MRVERTASLDAQPRDLASQPGRNAGEIEAPTITDLEPAEIAEAQEALLGELGELAEWQDGDDAA